MADNLSLNIEIRENNGKGAARALRREGKVPVIIYGGKKGEVKASLSLRELVVAYNKGGFSSRLVELNSGKEKIKVIPREVQLHPVSDQPLHVDFLQVEDDSKVKALVRVNVINEDKSPGVKRGGILSFVRRRVELLCLASQIPDSIIADVDGLQIGDSVHIGSIKLPENVTPTITDRNFTVIAIVGKKGKAEEDVEEVSAEAEEGAEAEDAKK